MAIPAHKIRPYQDQGSFSWKRKSLSILYRKKYFFKYKYRTQIYSVGAKTKVFLILEPVVCGAITVV
jgi:hypothetical protein